MSQSATRECMWLAVAACLSLAVPSFAQRAAEPRPAPLSPAQAESEARALLTDMLAQKPAQTNAAQLKVRDRNGQERSMPMRIEVWSDAGSSTSVYQANDPATRRQVKLTVIHRIEDGNDYLLSDSADPSYAEPKKVSGNGLMQPFAGSDFWLADLGLEFLHWPKQRLLKKEMRKSRFCDVLESNNPSPGAEGYTRVVCWIELERPHGIVHADAYNAKGEVLKHFDPTHLEKVQGEYQLQEIQIRNPKAGSRTQIEFDLSPQ